MAEGTKVGTGYVDIEGNFDPLHRELERLRGTWAARVRPLGDSLRRSLAPSLDTATQKLRTVSVDVDRASARFRGLDGSLRQNVTAARGFGRELDRTRGAIDRARTSVGGFGEDFRRVRDEVAKSRSWRPDGIRDLVGDLDRARASSTLLARSVRQSSTETRAGLFGSIDALRRWSSSTTKARANAIQLERAHVALEQATRRHGAASLQARDAELRLARAQERAAAGGGVLSRAFSGLGSRTTVLNQRFQLLRNTLAALKWPAIVTGVGLAVQALSALTASLVAVTAAAGPAIGVLGAVPGALVAAAQGFGVLRLATMGVADAFREQLRNQSAVAAAGGQVESAERAQADAARRLLDAKVAVTDAEEALTDAREDAARQLVDQRRAVVQATNDEERATLELRDARAALQALKAGPDDLDLADARDRTADATRAIADAERDYQTVLAQTTAILNDPNASAIARSRANADLADAEDRISDARRASARATRDLNDLERGPSRRDLAAARLDVRDAEGRLTDAITTRKRSTEELLDLEARGVEQSKQVIQAKRDLAAAHQGVRDAQLAVTDAARAMSEAQAGAAGTAANLNEEFDKLPRSARGFVRTLLGLKPRFDELRAVAADGFFPGARTGLLSAMRSFGPVRSVVDLTARAFGGLAAAAGRLVGSGGWGRDIRLIGGRNAVVIRRVGRAALAVADALRHVMVAAGPLVGWLSRVTLAWGRSWRESAKAGRESGRTARFFESTRRVLERLGSITGNVARAFRGIGRAAAPLGNEILAGLDRASGRFAKWTNSLRGQNQLRRYFDDSRPAIWELGRLLRDITNTFFRLGSQPGVARLLRQVRTELLPAVERLTISLGQTFGPALVSAITHIVELLSRLAGAGGVLSTVVRLADKAAQAFTWMLDNVPGFRHLTFGIIALGGALAGLKFLGAITGFARLAKAVTSATLAYRGLRAGVTAASLASSYGVAATGAARIAASSRIAALFSPVGMLRAAGGKAAVALAGSRLGSLLGSNITAGIGAALGGGRAGGAGRAAGSAGGGLLGGLRGGLMRAVRAGGMIGVGALIFDEIMSEFDVRARARSGDLLTEVGAARERQGTQRLNIMGRLPGGAGDAFRPRNPADSLYPQLQRVLATRSVLSRREIDDIASKSRQLNLTSDARAEMERIISLLRVGSRFRIGVSVGDSPRAIARIGNSLRLLRSGALSSLGDILRVSRRNSRLIAETLGDGSARGRREMARNMRATADAIERQMRRSGRVTDEGVQRIIRLLRNADLISPTREMARDFGREWARGMDTAKEVNRRGLDRMLIEARKMPGPMRRIAVQTWLDQIDAARNNKRITVDQYREMRSRVLAEFPDMRLEIRKSTRRISSNFIDMTNVSGDALGVFIDNAGKALSGFGARPVRVTIRRAREQGKQRGGAIVPGTGSGDTFRTALPAGSFVLNRNATAAFGFNRGGMVPVALEPRERVFTPGEVRRIGLSRLQSMNSAVPRFQTGGAVGGLSFALGPYDIPPIRYDANHAGGNSHVHVTGTSSGWIVALGRKLQQMGFMVGEHPAFGGVQFRHSATGGHYDALAIDINSAADETRAEVASIARLLGGSVTGAFGAAAFELARLKLAGPDGPLRDLGQAAIDKVHAAALKYGKSRAGAEGSEPPFVGRLTGNTLTGRVSVFGPPVEGAGSTASGLSSAEPGLALNINPGSDSGWNNATTDSWVRARTRFLVTIGSHRAVLPVIDKGPAGFTQRAIDVTGAGAERMGINPYLFPTDAIGTAVQVAQLGGLIQRLRGGGGVVSSKAVGAPKSSYDPSVLDLLNDPFSSLDISGGINRIADVLKKPLKRRDVKSLMRRTLNLISGIGLSTGDQSKLTELSNTSDMWAEWASRAGQLSYEMLYAERTPALYPDGRPILDGRGRPTFNEIGDPILDAERRPMTHYAAVNGLTEAGWTDKRLGLLGDLRNRLIQAVGVVTGEQGRVAQLIDQTRRQIAKIKAAIQKAANERRRVAAELARTRREIGEQQAKLARAREDLSELRRHPRRNAKRIEATQQKIARIREKISGLGDKRERLDDRLRVIGGEQQERVRVRTHLEGLLGDATDGTGLLGREAKMNDFMPRLLGSGDGFKGLVTVQGLGGPTDVMTGVLPEGMFGGEIFDAQQILRQLAVKPNPVPLPDAMESDSSTDDSERLALADQLLRESQQRYQVSQAQYRALEGFERDFPLARLPGYGGSFATGGVVPGAVGEARTIIAHGGERVVSVADQQAAAGHGAQQRVRVVVEDHRTRVYVDEVEAIVERVTNRQARIGARRLPGLARGR